MKIDLNAARNAGYSDDEIAEYLATENKFDLSGALSSGYSASEVIEYLSKGAPAAVAPKSEPDVQETDYTAMATEMQGTPLPPREPRTPRAAPAPREKPAPYKDRREALDDAVNFLEEGADQGKLREGFAKIGVSWDEIVAHGQKRASEFFKQQVLSPEETAALQANAANPPQPTGEIKASDYVPKATGLKRVEDIRREFTGGALAGFKGITDVAGADNPVGEVIGKAQEIVLRGRSSQAKAVDQLAAMITEEAENKGLWEQVKAGVDVFMLDPLKNTAQGAGTVVPTIAGGQLLAGTKLVQGIGAAGAKMLGVTGGAAASNFAGRVIVGSAMGVGMAKSQIYDTVKQDALDSGMTAAEADSVALKAQEYSQNPNVLFAVGVLGAASGGFGVESIASRLIGRAAVKEMVKSGVIKSTVKGVLAESPIEFAQGGFESYSGNVASRGEGFDVGLTRGVGTAATVEALSMTPIAATLGAAQGVSNRLNAPERQLARSLDEVIANTQFLGTQSEALNRLDPNSYDPSLIDPAQSLRGGMVGPSAPILNFTPPDSPTALAGLPPIVVPDPGVINVGTPNVAGPQPSASGPIPSDFQVPGVGATRFDAGLSAGVGGNTAGLAAVDGTASAIPGAGSQQPASLASPFNRASDESLLSRATLAAGNNNANTQPAQQWFGRKGDGYVTELDAQQALPGRQKMFPNLQWGIEQMPNGKFRLAGYETSTETNDGRNTRADQPVAAADPAPFAGTAGPGMGEAFPNNLGGQAAAPGVGNPGDGTATGTALPVPAPAIAGSDSQQNLGTTLPLAIAAPRPKAQTAIDALLRSGRGEAAVVAMPQTPSQQAASAIARMMGKTLTHLKYNRTGNTAPPNAFVLTGDNKNIFIDADADDAPLSLIIHEAKHTLAPKYQEILDRELGARFRPEMRAAFGREFGYSDSAIDDEIPAFFAQAASKRAEFLEQIREKLKNKEFAEAFKALIDNMRRIVSDLQKKGAYGDKLLQKYFNDVEGGIEVLSKVYADHINDQDAEATAEADGGEIVESRRAERVGDFDVVSAKDGSITVIGDAEQIRSVLPDDVVGRVTKEGLSFTPSSAQRVRAVLEGKQVAYGRGGQVAEKLPMKDGKYVGAPEKFNTPGKIPSLRRWLKQLAFEGEPGRYWYENSSREILRMTGGDVNEARKFVALLAIYSPQAKVDANSTFGLRAWAQYKAGMPINVKTEVMDDKATEAMADVDAFWSGEKTGNFFFNLLREIDPTTAGKQGATIDMWMMRAGQYDTDAPTSTQYSFMENETNRLARELGWEPQQVQAAIWVAMKARMENKGVKQRTEATSLKKGWIRFDYKTDPETGKKKKIRVILDEKKHRDNWLKHAFTHDPTTADTRQAKFDFSDGVMRHIGQVSFEARPGRTSGVLPGIHDAPYAQQVEFQQAVQKAFVDDQGRDLLAHYLGLLVDSDILAPGVWESEVSPSTQKMIAMAPDKGQEGKANVDPAQAKLLNVYTAVSGLLARQEGVGWHRPFYTTTKREANGLDINLGRPANPREAEDLEVAVGRWMADNGITNWQNKFAFISSPNGIRLVNFGIVDNGKLQKEIVKVAETVLPNGEVRVFASSGDMPTNKWKENPDGQTYVQRIRAEGRPDVLDWARTVLAPRVQRVFDEYSEKYGWGDPGELRFSERSAQAGSAESADRPSARADAPDDGRAREAGDRRGQQGSGREASSSYETSERATSQKALEALSGAPQVRGATGPDPRLVSVAEQYARENGIPFRRQAEYVQVDTERATRIADAYEAMPHAPNDLRVKAAYKELIKQTTAQYRALEKAGYKFWFVDMNKPNNVEYVSTPWNAMRDIRANKTMGVFPTDDGFGSKDAEADNLMLEDTGIKWPSGSLYGPRKRVLANDLFRAVHDAFGHGLEGAGFREQGEENAWQAHVRLFTGAAVGAITSETRGQNSWLNYGPYGEKNRTAKVEDTTFADQKTGLMPEWTWNEGRAGDAQFSNRAEPEQASTPRGSNTRPDSESGTSYTGIHYGSAANLSVLNSDRYGTGIKGAEAARLSDPDVDPRIKKRVYFYLPNNNADLPAREVGLGVHVYRANLGNMLDPSNATEAQRRRLSDALNGTDANAFETAVLDAGFRGYVNRSIGMAVVLNADVPVAYEGVAELKASNRTSPFYSALAKAIDEVPARLETQPAAQWKAWLASNAAKLGIKKEEIEWTGINDYLDLRGKDKVTKAEIGEYLNANGVQVEEVILQGQDIDIALAILEKNTRDELNELSDEDLLNRVDVYKIESPEHRQRVIDNVVEGERNYFAGNPDDLAEVLAAQNPEFDFGPKFSTWQLPGGQNYKELALVLPGKKLFEVPLAHRMAKKADINRLAHVRFNERADADGNRVLFIEELQSDWAQEGRKRGFVKNEKKWLVKKPGDKIESSHDTKEQAENAMQILARAYGEDPKTLGLTIEEGVDLRDVSGVPLAPFVQDTKGWLALGIKRMIAYAVENGFDKVAFINGQQSADRYDLSRYISSIKSNYIREGTITLEIKNKRGEIVIPMNSSNIFNEEMLPDVVGKEMAEKIISAGKGTKEFTGLDLKVGGEGMVKFYDQIVPQTVNDVLKKVGGGKMEAVNINAPEEVRMGAGAKAIVDANRRLDQPGFTITDAMREKVAEGLPLFSNRAASSSASKPIAFQGYKQISVPRVQGARNMESILKKLDDGKLTPQEFEMQIRLLAERMAEASAGKALNKMVRQRERGPDIVREKLIAARRRGEVESDVAEFALWALDQNPAMADGLAITVRQQKDSDGAAAGDYSPAASLMRVFKGAANADTAVHEILHHTERMMPQEIQVGIRKEWAKAFAKTLAKAEPKVRAVLEQMLEASVGNNAAQRAVTKAYQDGTLNPEVHYQLTNPSEYWAVNATRIMKGRYEADSWIGKAKQWMTEMVQKVKGILRLRSDAPVLRGLQSVLDGDGKFLSKKMLVQMIAYPDMVKPSNRAQTKTPEFRKWFGDSKIVDENGEPLVVYHGTSRKFKKFKTANGAFFTPDESWATYHAGRSWEDRDGKGEQDVMPVYLKIENPLILDGKEKDIDAAYIDNYASFRRKAIADGHDGLIINNSEGGTEYVVFKPRQIKSATKNQGAFDPNDSDITASNRQNAVVGTRFTIPEMNRRDRGRRVLQDDALRMKRVLEAVEKQGGIVGEAQNFYEALTLMPGRLQAEMDDFRNNVMRPLLRKAAEADIDLDELALYAYAMHAKERNAYIASINPRLPDGGSGMTDAQADQILADVAAGNKQADYDDLHKDLMAITSNTRQVMLREGLITQEDFDAMKNAYDNYIPLRGFENVDEETGASRPGIGRGVNVRGKETIRALGRKSRAGDLIENAVRDYQRVIQRVEKNDVGKVLLDFVLSNPDPDLWGVDIEKKQASFDKKRGVVQYTKVVEKGEDTIGVKVGGQQLYIRLADKDLTRALRQAWKDEISGFERVVVATSGWWNTWMRNVLTQYNPAFAAINIPRDALWSGTSAALADLGPKGLATYFKVYGQALMAAGRQETGTSGTTNKIFGNPRMDRLYQEFRAAGGITGGFYMRSLDDITKDLRTDMLQAGAKGRNALERVRGSAPYKLARGTANALQFMGTTSENATRFALYVAARENGKTPAQAGLLAKNGTTNFNRKGEWGGALNNLYLFFNASVQGIAQLLYVMKSRNVQAAMAGVTGVGVMLALYGAAAGGEDEDGASYWDKIPGYEKERNLIIMLPPGDALGAGMERVGKRGRYIKIPVQYGFNAFPNAGYMVADILRNQQDPTKGVTPIKAALHMASVVFGSVNPFGGAVDLSDGVDVLLAVAPTLADLPIQMVTERDTFGRPSSPEKTPWDMRPDSERMYTSQMDTAAARISKILNELGGGNEAKPGSIAGVETSVAPGTVKTLISATTGGLGSFVEQMTSSVLAMADSDNDLKANNIPFVNKFYGEVDEGANMRLASERMRAVKKSVAEIENQFKVGLNPEIGTEEQRMLALAEAQSDYQKLMTQMRKDEIAVIKSDMTAAEKKLIRQQIRIARDQLSTEVNKVYLSTLKVAE
jgi:hypothetical protein